MTLRVSAEKEMAHPLPRVDLAITVAEFARMSGRRIFQIRAVIPPAVDNHVAALIAIKQRSTDERACSPDRLSIDNNTRGFLIALIIAALSEARTS